MDSTLISKFDQEEWVARISRSLDEELKEEIEVPVSIFNVPKSLLTGHLNSYVPQQIAIGPYNCFTPLNCEMERYKIEAAKRIQKMHQRFKFHHVVDQFKEHDQRIRAHYHRYLDFHCDTLSWMMAMDASFLLEFLQVFAVREGTVLTTLPSRVSHFIDYAGTKSGHNAILRDIVMLENQIPLFLLRKVLEFQFSSIDLADELLSSMLIGFYKEISPFKGSNKLINVQALIKKSAHLLDFLYHTILPKFEEPSFTAEIDIEIDEEQSEVKYSEKRSFKNSSNVQKILDRFWNALSKFPWTCISSFKRMKMLKGPLGNLFPPPDQETAGKAKDENLKVGGNFDKPTLVEEINIPSATELSNVGVNFAPTNKGISSINFEVKTRTLYLPTITLDVNSEVVLRNLVAYETCNASGPLVLTRYTELMHGIIDTDEDVELLRKKGIIVNHLNRDGKVTKLWNGMSISIRLTKLDFLDKTIGDVNKYYKGLPSVKFKKLVKRYVFESWRCLTLLAVVLMLLLMGVQAFCSVSSCPRIFNLVESLE